MPDGTIASHIAIAAAAVRVGETRVGVAAIVHTIYIVAVVTIALNVVT